MGERVFTHTEMIMKKYRVLFVMLMSILLISACGPNLEETQCTNKVEIQYTTTLGWWGKVSNQLADYDSYDEYITDYKEPLNDWQELEPITTCDAALIDLMIEYLTMDAEDEQSSELHDDIVYFDLDIAHTGK